MIYLRVDYQKNIVLWKLCLQDNSHALCYGIFLRCVLYNFVRLMFSTFTRCSDVWLSIFSFSEFTKLYFLPVIKTFA